MTDAVSEFLEAVEDVEATIRPSLDDRLRTAVESDGTVRAELRAWNGSVGEHAETDPVLRAAARQANVLTNVVRYRVALGRAPPKSLRVTPVTPFRRLDAPAEVEDALDELESALEGRGDADADLLGARYADVLADEERRARGQFYTPSRVADLVVRWTLDGGIDRPRVLDPAAGTGTFHRSVFDHLRGQNRDGSSESLLSQLVAVDVDDVALYLAALRLSARAGGGPVDAFDRRPRSFFDLEPGDDLEPVDAVVGNPPFVRAGSLSPNRAHFREHLTAFGPGGRTAREDGEAPYANGDRALSRRSDASVYFVTHATRFLRPGGRLGMVLPAKWLESDYGVAFRRFLADQYRVHAVVGFDARAFDALVDTVLLLAERRESRRKHDRGGDRDPPVLFVRLDGRVAVSESLGLLRNGDASTFDTTNRDGPSRVVRREQTTVAEARQCSPYLRAPEELLPLLDDPDFVPLGELATVSRGVTTGANRFFLLDPADRERWGIDARFLRPALRSIRGVDTRSLSSADVDQSILDVHGFISDRLDGTRGLDGATEGPPSGGEDSTARAKAALLDAGHDAVVEYVEHGERRGWHEGRTCQARRVWFDLGALPTPDAFVPKLLRERVFTVRNHARAVPSNAIDCLSIRGGVDADLLLGVLDSSLSRALMEVWGRDEAGLLQLMTYETRTLPVPDVRAFSAEDADAVSEAASALEADRAGGDDGADRVGGDVGGQRDLDEAVLGAISADLGPERIRKLRERLVRRRVDGGARVEPPLS